MRQAKHEVNWIELARTTRVSRRKPSPPLGLSWDATTGVLSWQPPSDTSNITHYRLYDGETLELVREMPVGQTRLQDNLATGIVVLVAYNQPMNSESTPVFLTANILPPSSGGGGGTGAVSFIVSFTINADPYNVSVPANDDNGNALSGAVLGDKMYMFARMDATPNRRLIFSAEFKVRGGNTVSPASAYSVFEFVMKSASDPKWWQVGAVIGYA